MPKFHVKNILKNRIDFYKNDIYLFIIRALYKERIFYLCIDNKMSFII